MKDKKIKHRFRGQDDVNISVFRRLDELEAGQETLDEAVPDRLAEDIRELHGTASNLLGRIAGLERRLEQVQVPLDGQAFIRDWDGRLLRLTARVEGWAGWAGRVNAAIDGMTPRLGALENLLHQALDEGDASDEAMEARLVIHQEELAKVRDRLGKLERAGERPADYVRHLERRADWCGKVHEASGNVCTVLKGQHGGLMHEAKIWDEHGVHTDTFVWPLTFGEKLIAGDIWQTNPTPAIKWSDLPLRTTLDTRSPDYGVVTALDHSEGTEMRVTAETFEDLRKRLPPGKGFPILAPWQQGLLGGIPVIVDERVPPGAAFFLDSEQADALRGTKDYWCPVDSATFSEPERITYCGNPSCPVCGHLAPYDADVVAANRAAIDEELEWGLCMDLDEEFSKCGTPIAMTILGGLMLGAAIAWAAVHFW